MARKITTKKIKILPFRGVLFGVASIIYVKSNSRKRPYMDKNNIDEVLNKLAKNKATAEEKQEFSNWINALDEKSYKEVLDQYQAIVLDTAGPDMPELEQKIESTLEEHKRQKRPIALISIRNIAAVSIFLVIAVAGTWYFMNTLLGTSSQFDDNAQITSRYGDDILPGGDKATLILSGGKQIILDDLQEGVLNTESGIRLHKTGEGEIVYDFTVTEKEIPVTYNTIRTPKGGEYRVTLPDGSRVWLNSGSSITCPTVFDANERIVEIRGEVYFEVKTITSPGDSRRVPFIVQTEDQSIEVLGTEFNIKAYPDMERMETTLVEGKIRVQTPLKEVLLQPGEQAQVARRGTVVVTDQVDVAKVVAWKNGYFQFSNDSIEDIMLLLQRWYDVDIKYMGSKVNAEFGGQISRSRNISEVLQILELTGEVRFRIDGRTIEVLGK